MNLEYRIDNGKLGDAAEAEPAVLDREEVGFSRKRFAIAAAGLLVILFLVYRLFFAEPATEPAADASQVVTVISPSQDAITRRIEATGTLAARNDIAVSAVGEGGRIVRVNVDAGDWVKQGQVLAVIDRSVQSQQLASLRAQIGVAQADLDLAQSELERALQLVERGFVSKADVDRKTATRDGARARVRAAQASVREAEARTARLDIRAPVSGLVLERMAETGQTVTQGSGTLFRMARGGDFELLARLNENELAFLSVGTPALVTPTGTDLRISGRVWQISPVIDPQTRQGTARIALPFSKALRPGGFASAEIRAGEVTAAVVPESAIMDDEKGEYVYVVDQENRVRRRDVTTGLVTKDGIAITYGVNGNERIVARAGGFLNVGDEVKPRLQGGGSAAP